MLAEREQEQRVARRDLRGHTAVVTGAASGLGREIALAFARRGVNIAFNYIELPQRDISAQALLTETTLRSCGVEVYSEHCDVRDSQAVNTFVSRAVTELGGVHFLVNNASTFTQSGLGEVTSELLKSEQNIHSNSPLILEFYRE